jgi:hypothetical protein
VGTITCDSVDIFLHARHTSHDTIGGAMKCRYCGNLRDAGIQDNIPACHACYCKRGGVNE